MSSTDNPTAGYKERRWHLLKVGANGEVRPFTHIKGWVMFGCALLVVMLGTMGWFIFAWLALQEELDTARKINIQQKQILESLRNEKETVLARLAITQSKLKLATQPPPDQTGSEAPKGSVQTPAKARPLEKKAAVEDDPARVEKAADTEKTSPASAKDTVANEKVIADNLFVCANPDDNSLNVAFKVINMGTKKQPASGHAFIILKGSGNSQDQWLVLPKAILENGKPAESRGQRFRIYNYRTIQFKVGHENPGVFTHATIFVYQHSGELIFEEDFELEPVETCP